MSAFIKTEIQYEYVYSFLREVEHPYASLDTFESMTTLDLPLPLNPRPAMTAIDTIGILYNAIYHIVLILYRCIETDYSQTPSIHHIHKVQYITRRRLRVRLKSPKIHEDVSGNHG